MTTHFQFSGRPQVVPQPLVHITAGINTHLPFLNKLKSAAWWVPNTGTTTRAAMDLDSQNYPRAIPSGVYLRARMMQVPDSLVGVSPYSGSYKLIIGAGIGTVGIVASGSNLVAPTAVDASVSPVVIDFTHTADENGMYFDIHATDAGNHVRDVAIVHADHYTAWQSDPEGFDPDWLTYMAQFPGVLRDMKASSVNQVDTSTAASWPTDGSYSYSLGYAPAGAGGDLYRGWPLERIVALHNALNADVWLNIQAQANDAFVTSTFEYLRDNLNAGLTVRVEYGNEGRWNGSFATYNYLAALATSLGSPWTVNDLYGKRICEITEIGQSIMGADRCRGVLAGFFLGTGDDEAAMVAAGWQSAEPSIWRAPYKAVNEYAVSLYVFAGYRTHDQGLEDYFMGLGTPGVALFWRTTMADLDPAVENGYRANANKTPLAIPSIGANDCVNLWPNMNADRLWNTVFAGNSDLQTLLGADVDNYVRIVTPGTGGAGTSDIELRDSLSNPWRVAIECASPITDSVQTLVSEGRLVVRQDINSLQERLARLETCRLLAQEYGLELTLYEGGLIGGTLRNATSEAAEYDAAVAWWKARYHDDEAADLLGVMLEQITALGIRTWCYFGDVGDALDDDTNQGNNGQSGLIFYIGEDGDTTTPLPDQLVRWAADKPLVLSAVPAAAAPISAVAADGWQATYATTPSGSIPGTETVTLSRTGYVGATASTISEDLLVTTRLRQPYPNEASLTTDTVVLSDYVYSTDTIVGVTNNSTAVSPKPVANWGQPDRRRVGDTLAGEIIAGHRNARGGEQVAAVVVSATDGTTTVSQTVTSSSVVTDASGQKVNVYAYSLDISTLTDDAEITVDALVYPHIGGSASILDSADQSNRWEFSTQTYYRAATASTPIAYVDGVGGGTPTVSTTDATAAANPYATISDAIAGLRGFAGADASGAVIYLEEGTHVLQAAFGTDLTMTAGVTITPASGALKVNTIVEIYAASFRPRTVGGGWFFLEGLTVNRTGSGWLIGEADSRTEIAFIDCTINNGNQSAHYAGTNADCGGFFGCTLTNLHSSTIAATTGKTYFRFRGNTFTPTGSVEGFFLVGNLVTGQSSGGLTTVTTGKNGMITAFNSFEDQQTRLLSMGSSATVTGVFIAQNVIEWTSATADAVVWVNADAADYGNTHVILHHNTVVGFDTYGRANLFYDEAGTARTSSLFSFKSNIITSVNTKSDVFATDGTRVGNWAFEFSVGCAANFTLYMDANGGGIGGSFAQDYIDAASDYGTSRTVLNDPLFTDPQHTTSGPTAGSGGGDYSLQAGSPAKSMAPALLKYDAAGATRTATTSAGAYQ